MATAGSLAATTSTSGCLTYSKRTVAQSIAPLMQTPWSQLLCKSQENTCTFLGWFLFPLWMCWGW